MRFSETFIAADPSYDARTLTIGGDSSYSAAAETTPIGGAGGMSGEGFFAAYLGGVTPLPRGAVIVSAVLRLVAAETESTPGQFATLCAYEPGVEDFTVLDMLAAPPATIYEGDVVIPLFVADEAVEVDVAAAIAAVVKLESWDPEGGLLRLGLLPGSMTALRTAKSADAGAGHELAITWEYPRQAVHGMRIGAMGGSL